MFQSPWPGLAAAPLGATDQTSISPRSPRGDTFRHQTQWQLSFLSLKVIVNVIVFQPDLPGISLWSFLVLKYERHRQNRLQPYNNRLRVARRLGSG